MKWRRLWSGFLFENMKKTKPPQKKIRDDASAQEAKEAAWLRETALAAEKYNWRIKKYGTFADSVRRF